MITWGPSPNPVLYSSPELAPSWPRAGPELAPSRVIPLLRTRRGQCGAAGAPLPSVPKPGGYWYLVPGTWTLDPAAPRVLVTHILAA